MKKVVVMCMVALCMAMPGFSSLITELEYCVEDMPEKKAAQLREDLKDAAKLRAYMVQLIGSYQASNIVKKVETFKQRFSVSDKAMQTALMDIIREAGKKNKWKKRQGLGDKSLDGLADWQIEHGLIWMIFCADAEGKAFLMKIATDSTVAREFRGRAAKSYLMRSDEKESLETVTRFLTGDMKGTVDLLDSGLYYSVVWVYDKAEGDPKTREAIVAMVSAAVAEEKEDDFKQADELLAERIKEYAESPQRKAALERMNPPFRRNAP